VFTLFYFLSKYEIVRKIILITILDKNMDTNSMDDNVAEINDLKKNTKVQFYYPFVESGPLFPLLDNEDLLYEFYFKSNKIKDVKNFCKKTKWTDKPEQSRVLEKEQLKKIIRSMCNSHEARQKLSKGIKGLALHQVIWQWFRCEYPELYEKVTRLCINNKDKRYFITIEKLKEFLYLEDIESKSDNLPITYISLAFAMLQKELRIELGLEIVKSHPLIGMLPARREDFIERTTGEVSRTKKSDNDELQFKEISSLDELVSSEKSFGDLIIDFSELTNIFVKNTGKLKEYVCLADFRDSGRVIEIISILDITRKKIIAIYEILTNKKYFTCMKTKCDECCLIVFEGFSLNSGLSFEVIVENLIFYKSGLRRIIEKTNNIKKEIEKLKLMEIDLISSANLTNDLYVLDLSNSNPCTLFEVYNIYREHIDEVKCKASVVISEFKSKINSKVEELISITGVNQNDEYLERIGDIKSKALLAKTITDLEACNVNLDKVSTHFFDKEEFVIRDTAIKLSKVKDFTRDNLLKFCQILNSKGKSSISFLLLYFFEQENKVEDIDGAPILAVETLFDSVFYDAKDGIPLLTAFNEMVSDSNFFSFIYGNVNSKEHSERIIITMIAAALMGHVESAYSIFIKINAIETTRFNFPEYLEKIVEAIVCQKEIKIASKEFLDNISCQQQDVEEIIAFEDGKFRHIQKEAKHFSRFETKIVYPALTVLWKDISFCIKDSNFKHAHNVLSGIDVSTWYQELIGKYDKNLIDHHHYTATIKRVMVNFLEKISDHLSYCENEFDINSFVIMEPRLIESFDSWSKNSPARISLINNIKKIIKLKNNTTSIKPFWHSIVQCQQVILSCPNFILWLRKQRSPLASKNIMALILDDLSNNITFDETKNIYLRWASWESISIMFENSDKELSREHRLKFDAERDSIKEKSGDLLKWINNQLSRDFIDCIDGGRLPAAYILIEQYDNEIEESFENKRDIRLAFVRENLSILNEVKDQVANSNMSEEWLDSIFTFSGKIERSLRAIQRPDYIEQNDEVELQKIEQAIDSLKFCVETQSQNFEEIEYHLASNSQVIDDNKVSQNLELAIQKCPDLISLWNSLSSAEPIDNIETKRSWLKFVKGFAKISNLYHDETDDKKRFGVVRSSSANYAFNIYQTAFYKPQSEFLKRPVRLYLYRNNVDLPALKRLEDELSSEDSLSFLHIVFVPQGMEKIQRFFKYNQGFKNFLLVGDPLLYSICALDRHEVGIRQALHASVSDLANSSPFVSQGYCHQENNIYVGRNDIIQKLLNNPQAMIWGGRRIGKTSVLHALENALNNRNYKVAYVYVDIQDDGDPDLAIAKKIALTLQLGTVKDIATFEKKISNLRREGTKVAFLIDEIDEYIKKSRKVHENSFPLATVLRQLVMDDANKETFLVYSGYHQLYYEAKLNDEKRRVGHPFINIAQQIPIRDLTYDDINELVKTGFQDMLGIKVHPSVPRLIAKKASRHPAFVQQFCRCLLEHVSNRRTPGTVVTITTKDVEAVYNTNVSIEGGEQAFIHYFNETLGYNLSHLGHAILLAVTDPEFTEKNIDDKYFYSKDILILLNEWCSLLQIDVPNPVHFHQTIELLIMTNILTQDTSIHDRYRATYPTHLNILKRLDKINKSAIEDSLKKYDEKERDKGILL
jgi:hypothetical protein